MEEIKEFAKEIKLKQETEEAEIDMLADKRDVEFDPILEKMIEEIKETKASA